MADSPKYGSIIDAFLAEREPDWKDLGLKDAKTTGDEWLERTHEHADLAFLDEIAEGASKHTNVPPTSKGATLTNRMLDKENASPRLGAAMGANTRTAANTDDYKSAVGDDASLMAEVTQSIESAGKGDPVKKKTRTDSEIQKYVRQLLNQGETPNKIATQLKKLAEIELFNHSMATRYLQDNAGVMGMAYLEPNTFMDKQNPTYKRTASEERCDTCRGEGSVCGQCKRDSDNCDCSPLFAGNREEPAEYPDYEDCPDCDGYGRSSKTGSSQDCVRQAKAWKAAGITPRAKSVKQITACSDCSYYKKNGSTKSCGLYQLPVVGSAAELSAVVNRMTAGVPSKSKKAALVQIANRLPEQNIPVKSASLEAPFVRQASFTQERDYGFKEASHFSGSKVQQLHTAGHSFKEIEKAASKKFGALEASKGIREFVATLHKEKGKIIVAKADAEFLKKMGFHNEAIIGAAKCASCKAHMTKETHKAAKTEGVTRASDQFVEMNLSTVRATKTAKPSNFDSAKVAKLHDAGYPLKKIVASASARYGSAQVSKAVRDWANNLKNTNTKIALSQVDCTVLNKMGIKLSSKNPIIGAEKCGSCSYRNGMHCGLTGGTLLSFPGLNQIASNKKVASGAPEDGRAMLNEFDLVTKSAQGDIDMSAPERAEIQMGAIMDAGEIE